MEIINSADSVRQTEMVNTYTVLSLEQTCTPKILYPQKKGKLWTYNNPTNSSLFFHKQGA